MNIKTCKIYFTNKDLRFWGTKNGRVKLDNTIITPVACSCNCKCRKNLQDDFLMINDIKALRAEMFICYGSTFTNIE